MKIAAGTDDDGWVDVADGYDDAGLNAMNVVLEKKDVPPRADDTIFLFIVLTLLDNACDGGGGVVEEILVAPDPVFWFGINWLW